MQPLRLRFRRYVVNIHGRKMVESLGLTAFAQNFWPIMQAGWRVWPFFSLLSFTIIPLDKRPLAGSLVGFAWSIYMSLLAAR